MRIHHSFKATITVGYPHHPTNHFLHANSAQVLETAARMQATCKAPPELPVNSHEKKLCIGCQLHSMLRSVCGYLCPCSGNLLVVCGCEPIVWVVVATTCKCFCFACSHLQKDHGHYWVHQHGQIPASCLLRVPAACPLLAS